MRYGPLILPALVAGTSLTCLSLATQQASQPPQYIEKSYPVPAGNQLPDSNAQMQMHQKQSAKKNFDAANFERKRQIDNDTAELVRLAKELNSAVQKQNQGRLPTDLFRKAELIERLAHGVREKMKLTGN